MLVTRVYIVTVVTVNACIYCVTSASLYTFVLVSTWSTVWAKRNLPRWTTIHALSSTVITSNCVVTLIVACNYIRVLFHFFISSLATCTVTYRANTMSFFHLISLNYTLLYTRATELATVTYR